MKTEVDQKMRSCCFIFNTCLLISLCLLTLFTNVTVSDPRATEAALICSNKTTPLPQRGAFITNFLAALDTLTPEIVRQRYAAVVNGTGNSTVYAYGECMRDLDGTDCNLCFARCKTQVIRCLPFQLGTRGGRLYFDGCFIRYDDYDFFNESVSSEDKILCGNETVFDQMQSGSAAGLMRNLSSAALENDGFSVGEVGSGNVSVFGLVQCWQELNSSSCRSCLDNAVSKIGSCLPNSEGRVVNAGCYVRYATHKFYNNSGPSTSNPPPDTGSHHLAVILAVTSSTVAFILIVATAIFVVKKRQKEKTKGRKELGALLATLNKSKLNFTYESLERATNYFDHSNKLGQGGSGSVYKGMLPDGKVVAIKRLLFNTRQWVDHFFNEVNLISEIEHKNLVKLLGCSIAGPESLLVYEFVPNQSLHEYLFVKKNVEPLTWNTRYNILLGTAEGLAFLHEESELRIIHRDIKLSNVLLDADFMPKIADFGLARLFPQDMTHITTAIAGTLGYMAPEYIVRGKLTEKADVYSYGVLLMEVIIGKKNNAFARDACAILQMAWNLYGRGRLTEAVDPALRGNFPEDEASLLLQIGLLCVQASADLRPSMSVVVKMFKGEHDIPQPTQPPFLTAATSSTSSEISPTIPSDDSHNSRPQSYTLSSGDSITQTQLD